MSYLISPSYTYEKLDSPSGVDLIDVFEDRVRKWLIDPAKFLLNIENGVVPAVSIILGYFEGIEIYYSGQDSKGASKDFFRRSFKRVFHAKSEADHIYDQIVDSIYAEVRCGFAHDGLFRNRVFFSEARPEALHITWPRNSGGFVMEGKVESIVINASRFVDGVETDFGRYISVLRNESDSVLKSNFLAAVNLKWGLNEQSRVIGMPEHEFFRKP